MNNVKEQLKKLHYKDYTQFKDPKIVNELVVCGLIATFSSHPEYEHYLKIFTICQDYGNEFSTKLTVYFIVVVKNEEVVDAIFEFGPGTGFRMQQDMDALNHVYGIFLEDRKALMPYDIEVLGKEDVGEA